MRQGEVIIVRHGDKGKWKIDEQELRAQLAPKFCEMFTFDAEGNLVKTEGVEV
jgi:hypothetical protein